LLGEEEAAAAAGGGGRDPLLRRRSTSGVLPLALRCRGGSYPADAWPSRRWPRSESVSPGGWMRCAARPPVCICVFTVCRSRARARRGCSTSSAFSVPLPERGYALFAEPTGGTRPGGTCQFQSVPLPERGYALFAEPTGGTRPGGTCQFQSVPLNTGILRRG
jgi:hypothetical protein